MLITGHRGAKGLAPENTITGFRTALDHAVDAIEFDVRTTADGKVIAIHDDSLKRTIGKDIRVSKTDYETLKNHDSQLVTLEAALDFLLPKTSVILEIKPGSDPAPIIQILRKRKLTDVPTEKFRVASFSQNILRQIKKELPGITLVVNEAWSSIRAQLRARELGTRFITMNQRWLWRGFIKAVSRGGYLLSAYPLNDTKKTRRWAKSGLYSTITDYPDRFQGLKEQVE